MITEVIRNDFDDKTLDITFMVTNACNFQCVYCIENIPYANEKCQYLDLIKTYDFILKYISLFPNNTLNVRFYGGEPTLHKDLLDFCKKINLLKNVNEIEIFTNFSDKLQVYYEFLNISKLQLFISYHTSKLMSVNEFKHKLYNCLLNKNFCSKITCNIMLENVSDELFFSTYNLYKDLQNLYKHYNFNSLLELIPLFSTSKYISLYNNNKLKLFKIINNINNTTIDFTIIDNNNNRNVVSKVVGYNSFDFKNWKCTSGVNSLFVDQYGFIYPCGSLYTKRQYIYKNTVLKNIFTCNDITQLFEYTTCPYNDCVLCVPMKVKNINNIDTQLENIDTKFNKK